MNTKRIVLRTSDMHKRVGFTNEFVSTGVLERCLEEGFEVWVMSARKSFDEKDDFWRAVVPPERIFHAGPNDWIHGSSPDHMRLWVRLMDALGVEIPAWIQTVNEKGDTDSSYDDWCDVLRAKGIPVGGHSFMEDVCFEIPHDQELPSKFLCEADWVKSLPVVVEVQDKVDYEDETWVYARLSHNIISWRDDTLTDTFYKSLPDNVLVRNIRAK